MNRQLKLISLTTLPLLLLGVFFSSLTPNDSYNFGENLAYAQAEEQKEEEQPEKEAEDTEKTEGEKGDLPKEGKEKKPKKIKLPKQNATVSPETFRMMEMIEKKK